MWLVISALLNNGLVEETMMRGYIFRHLREGRPFWRAAALSTVYFAGYHVPLILTAGLLTAYIYEHGNNTVWGPGLYHALYNAPAFVFVFPAAVQPAASSLYLVAGRPSFWCGLTGQATGVSKRR